MTKHPTAPNQRCRVIGGRGIDTGEAPSPNQGKVVTTMYLHQIQAGDSVPVWHCRGEGLQTYYGVGTEIDFLNYWLEVVIEELPAPPEAAATKRELVTSE